MSSTVKTIQTLQFPDITEKIIGAAMRVYTAIGPGFPEKIYHRCLVIKFDAIGLKCLSEVERDIFYRGIKFGSRRLDILVEEKVSIELKTVSDINSSQQVKS